MTRLEPLLVFALCVVLLPVAVGVLVVVRGLCLGDEVMKLLAEGLP